MNVMRAGVGIGTVMVAMVCLGASCNNFFEDPCDPDREPPVITCPSDQIVQADENDKAAVAPLLTLVHTEDNCPAVLAFDYYVDGGNPGTAPLTELTVGTHTIRAESTDSGPNSASCTFKVTVTKACALSTTNKPLEYTHVTGSIDDVTNTVEHFDDANAFTLETHKDIRFHIDIDLQLDVASGKLMGTGKVKWTNHSFNIQRVQCGTLGQHRDYTDREWTVNLVGQFYESMAGLQGVSASGTPDGSDVAEPYVLHEDDCTPPFSQMGSDQARATWNGFNESGLECNTFDLKRDLPLGSGSGGTLTGEKYHQVHFLFE